MTKDCHQNIYCTASECVFFFLKKLIISKQGPLKLTKCERKDIYNVTKDIYTK